MLAHARSELVVLKLPLCDEFWRRGAGAGGGGTGSGEEMIADSDRLERHL